MKQTNQFIAQFNSSITEDVSVARAAPTEDTNPPELTSCVAFFHSRLLSPFFPIQSQTIEREVKNNAERQNLLCS